ncbi:MAG TPA: DUF3048 domain-containing protein [Frankiaceae bacterium]|nr:DUF3048 domain-containing protein [Frankiaceae bacterium]
MVAGCGSDGHSVDGPASSPSVASTQPLTGLPLSSDPAAAKRPALFVKIENAPQARPQTGLEKADVVYEAIAEGGITRFAAIFQSTDPGDLGPVRSVRPQDPDIAAPLHGIAAFSGGVTPIVNDLSTVAQDLSADASVAASAYHRTTDRVAPHNLYATASKLWALAAAPFNVAPKPLFDYGAMPAGATPASAVDVPLSSVADVRWTWDGKAWRRSQDGVPFTVTGAGQIGPANVILQYVQIDSAGYQDVAGTPVPSTVLIGTGKAQVLRGGKVISGTWAKAGRFDVTHFTTADGQVLSLQPGRTWVELVPNTVTATVTP